MPDIEPSTTQKIFDPNLVTDRLIEVAYTQGQPLSQIEVQKLLYFVEGWHLAMVGPPVFVEAFEAWKNGPVLPSIYERLKRHGAQTIPRSEIRSRDFTTLGALMLDLIDRVYATYRQHDPGAMVGLTHLPGTPWAKIRASNGVAMGESSRDSIPKEMMREWFSAVWQAALEPASEEVHFAAPEEYADWAGVTVDRAVA